MKVKYIGASDIQVQWGGCDDPRGKLKVGEVYEIEHLHKHTGHTKIQLSGVRGRFNDSSFEYVRDD